jgi:hypothetical protein
MFLFSYLRTGIRSIAAAEHTKGRMGKRTRAPSLAIATWFKNTIALLIGAEGARLLREKRAIASD